MWRTVRNKGIVWTALTQAVLLESIRRKDLYVSLILSVLLIGAASMVGSFGVHGLEAFLKDVALTVVNVLSLVLAVLFSSRLVPDEVEQRTVYPLLARPITRADFLLGKFFGAYLLSLLSLALFSVIAWGALTIFNLSVGSIFYQHILLRCCVLAVACALTLALSVTLPNSGATVTLTFVLTLGTAAFGQSLLLLQGGAKTAMQFVYRGSYFVLPHLDLFDLTRKVSGGMKPLSDSLVASLVLYALVYVVLYLLLGAWRFQRRAL